MFLPKKCQKFKITLLCFITMSFAHQHSSLYTSKPITRCLTIAIERKGNISVHYAWERQTDLNTASTSICVHQCIIDPFLMCINTTPMFQAPCLRMHWNQLLLTMHQHWTCATFDTTHHYVITPLHQNASMHQLGAPMHNCYASENASQLLPNIMHQQNFVLANNYCQKICHLGKFPNNNVTFLNTLWWVQHNFVKNNFAKKCINVILCASTHHCSLSDNVSPVVISHKSTLGASMRYRH